MSKQENITLQPGQEVWVEAVVRSVGPEDNAYIWIMDWRDAVRDAVVPLSSIHPAPQPAKKGE